MHIISISKTAGDVESALEKVLDKVNGQLSKVDGVIEKTNFDISAGPSGASISIILGINGYLPRKKEVLGVNIRGISREDSMEKATRKLNTLLKGKKGEIASIYSKTIVTPLPGRVYTTMIVAINEESFEEPRNANIRRGRIKKTLELLNGDPATLNVAKVAGVFGVSRTIIYRDLEALGFKRTGENHEEDKE